MSSKIPFEFDISVSADKNEEPKIKDLAVHLKVLLISVTLWDVS